MLTCLPGSRACPHYLILAPSWILSYLPGSSPDSFTQQKPKFASTVYTHAQMHACTPPVLNPSSFLGSAVWSGILPPFTAALYVDSLISWCLPFLAFSSLPEEPWVLASPLTPMWSCSHRGHSRPLTLSHWLCVLFQSTVYLTLSTTPPPPLETCHGSSSLWISSLPDFNHIPCFHDFIYTKDLISPSLPQIMPVLWHQNRSFWE